MLTDKDYLFSQYPDKIDICADYEQKETLAAVMDIINTELSESERRIILDSFFGDKDDAALAAEMGISPSLFSYRKRKVLNKIRAIFHKKG